MGLSIYCCLWFVVIYLLFNKSICESTWLTQISSEIVIRLPLHPKSTIFDPKWRNKVLADEVIDPLLLPEDFPRLRRAQRNDGRMVSDVTSPLWRPTLVLSHRPSDKESIWISLKKKKKNNNYKQLSSGKSSRFSTPNSEHYWRISQHWWTPQSSTCQASITLLLRRRFPGP